MGRRLWIFGALLLGSAAGCPFSFTNDEHCAAQSGDATCAAADPSTPYCAFDGCGLYDEVSNRTGCVAEMPSNMSCYSPCGGKQDANARTDCEASTSSTTTVGPGSGTDIPTSGSSEDSAETTTTTGGCECDPQTPICIDGECVACEDDAFCFEQFEGVREVCFESDCVVCAPTMATLADESHRGCAASMPNCTDGACTVPCLFHDDCPQTGCDLRSEMGVCGPVNRVFYVNPGGNDGNDGTAESPLATIGEALSRTEAEPTPDDYSLSTILLAPGTYTESLEFGTRTIILRPANPDAARPILTSPGTDPVFSLLGGSGEQAVLNVAGVDFRNAPGPVAQLGPTTRFLADDVQMIDNTAGLRIDGGRAFFRNSVIARTTETPFVFEDAGDVGLVASTAIDNDAAIWFDCSAPTDESVVTIRDSIVGTWGGPAFSTFLTDNCLLTDGATPLRSVAGDVGDMGAFRVDEDYRLDANPGAMYQIDNDAVEFCAEGDRPPPEDRPCPPMRDIDGKDRSKQNWAGASVP